MEDTAKLEHLSRTLQLLREFMGVPEAGRVINELHDKTFGVEINKHMLETQNGLVMVTTVVKLLTRMVSRLTINTDSVDENFRMLLEQWTEQAAQLPGDVNISYNVDYDLLLVIGEPISQQFLPKTFINSNGWESYVSCNPIKQFRKEILQNAIGASMTAAFGVAELFKLAILDMGLKIPHKVHDSFRFSSFTYQINEAATVNPPLPDVMNIETVYLIGGGAIGNSFSFTLSWLPLSGLMIVLDTDRIDLSNLNRYLLADLKSVGRSKAELIREEVTNPNFRVVAINEPYLHFARHYGVPTDIVVCTVDSVEARREIQSDLPRILLDGATSGFTFSVSRHDVIHSACLGCIHPPNPDDFVVEEEMARTLGWALGDVFEVLRSDRPMNEGDLSAIFKYASLPIEHISKFIGKPLRYLWANELCGIYRSDRKEEQQVVGTAGFVSIMPGILLAGELIKERYFKQNVLNSRFIAQVLVGPKHHSLQMPLKERRCACFCQTEIIQKAYYQKHGIGN
jgi:molybdopterin/thiamine biosynthesis adenylyltransferase